SEILHPRGMDENSPAFQRWDLRRTRSSPVGTAEPVVLQPSLRDLSRTIPAPSPAAAGLGYSRLSLRDRGAGPLSQIQVALDFQPVLRALWSCARRVLRLASIVTALILAAFAHAQPSARVTVPFDAGWRFFKGDAPGAEQAAFNDSSWRVLNVPHDWSIEGPFAETNRTGGAGGFLPGGTGWYRKHFLLPENFSRDRVFVEFDGVMANSDVWVNGFHLGRRPFGYVSFNHDLTGHLH